MSTRAFWHEFFRRCTFSSDCGFAFFADPSEELCHSTITWKCIICQIKLNSCSEPKIRQTGQFIPDETNFVYSNSWFKNIRSNRFQHITSHIYFLEISKNGLVGNFGQGLGLTWDFGNYFRVELKLNYPPYWESEVFPILKVHQLGILRSNWNQVITFSYFVFQRRLPHLKGFNFMGKHLECDWSGHN